MKTVIQASVIFLLVIMITITATSMTAHHTLKNELASAVSNGVEHTINTMLIKEAYPYNGEEEIIVNLLQYIIDSKSSDNQLTVNIYNSNNELSNGILEVEVIEEYEGLGGVSREASYRTRAYVYTSDESSLFKYVDPSTETTPSEKWVFTPEDITKIKEFLATPDYKFPSQVRNHAFLTDFSYCKN